MSESVDWESIEQSAEREVAKMADAVNARIDTLDSMRQSQLDRIETKLDEVLAFRDLILETAGPFLAGGKSKIWLALLAKSKGPRT